MKQLLYSSKQTLTTFWIRVRVQTYDLINRRIFIFPRLTCCGYFLFLFHCRNIGTRSRRLNVLFCLSWELMQQPIQSNEPRLTFFFIKFFSVECSIHLLYIYILYVLDKITKNAIRWSEFVSNWHSIFNAVLLKTLFSL